MLTVNIQRNAERELCRVEIRNGAIYKRWQLRTKRADVGPYRGRQKRQTKRWAPARAAYAAPR